MLQKMTRLALYAAVTAPLFILPQAYAEQALELMSELPSVNVTAMTTTETTAFDLSHSSTSQDALLRPLNINTASELELTALSGIGERKALRIVQWREQHGEFNTTAELAKVSGIGKATVAKLADTITVIK